MELTSSSKHVLPVSSSTVCATVVGPISAEHARHVGSGRRTRVPLTLPTESSPLVITAQPPPTYALVGSKSCSHLFLSGSCDGGAGLKPFSLSPSVNDLAIASPQHGGDVTSSDSATKSSNPGGHGVRKSLPRPASAPLIKVVGEPLGSGAQAVVCRATLSSSKERVALVMGKQPIPDATMQVLYLLAARRPKHVVAVLHPDVTAAVAPSKCCSASRAHISSSSSRERNFDGTGHHYKAGEDEREYSIAIQECTCSLSDILAKKRHACTKKGFADAVRHLVSHAEVEDECPGLHDCDESVTKVTPARTAPSLTFSDATDIPSPPSTIERVFFSGELITPLASAFSNDSCSNIAPDDCLMDILAPSCSTCSPPSGGLDLQSDRRVSEAFLAGLARHILIGLRGLHDLHLAHNDLKMSNILFDEATGTFLLGDLLNASFVDVTQPPTPTTPLTLSDATVVSGIVRSQTSRRQLPPSLFAQSPFRADIRAFALLLLQVSQSIEHDDATTTYDEENKQEEGNQPVKDNSVHARRRRCTADNAGDALRLADDGSLTGCNEWLPWEDVERHWMSDTTTGNSLAPPSPKMMAFIKQAFCGHDDRRSAAHHPLGKDHLLAPRDEASTLLGHPFLTQYGRSNEQWKQLLKAALSDCAATSSSTHQSGGGVRFGMHRRTATGSTTMGSRHGSMPTTPVVSSPHHTSAASDAAVYAALFPYSPTTSRVPSSPTLDEMNVLTSSMRGSNNSLCGLFPPSVPPPVQRCNSHRIPLPFVRQPQGRR